MLETELLQNETNQRKEVFKDYLKIAAGCLLFAFSVNIFVVPAGMYNGGVYGISQVIRTLLQRFTSVPLPTTFDVAGVINFLLNVPLFYIAYRCVSRQFFVRTVSCVAVQTLLLTVIPIPKEPVFDEPLLNALVGGVLTGYALGMMLRSKGCSGGVDIVGIYFLKKDIKITVGKISIFVNAVVYLVCAWLFDLNVACYSVIYAAIISYTMDRTHYQNINMLCFIITKNKQLQYDLTKAIGRGVTYWDGKGAFTDESTIVNAVVISKYEVKELKRIVGILDPSAFVFMRDRKSVV